MKSDFSFDFEINARFKLCHTCNMQPQNWMKHALLPTLRLLSEWFYWQRDGNDGNWAGNQNMTPGLSSSSGHLPHLAHHLFSRESKLSRTLLGFSCQSLDIVSGQSLCFRFHLETANFPLSITARISHFSDLKNVDRTIRPGPLEDVIGYN